MKLGDIWIKLGLKKDEFSKGMKEAGDETKSLGDKIKALPKWAKVAFAAVGAAIAKFATDAVKMTQKWGDMWNQTVAGMKGAYSTFVRQISSGDGWNNLFSNMREAYRVSKEVAAALDEIFERKTSYSYQEAQVQKEIAEWQLIMRDSSKSDAERKKAAQEIINAEERLANVRRGIYEDEAKAYREQFKVATGLKNDDDINFLVKEYNLNRDIIKQAREYNAEREKLNLLLSGSAASMGMPASPGQWGKEDDRYTQISAQISDLDAKTSDAVKHAAELTKMYDRGNDELVKNMAQAEVGVIRVDTEMMHAQTRATALLGTLNRTSGGGSGEDPRLKEAEKIQQRLSQFNKSELQLLREKYNEERALLEALGMDTTKLAEEYAANIKKIIDVPLDSMEKLDDIVIDLDIEFEDDPVQEFIAKYEEDLQRMQDVLADFRDGAVGGMSDAIQELSNQFAGLSEINPGAILQALLTPLAEVAIKQGEILIAQGIGVEACKKALESLNGFAAIAAGTALVAIGAAAKSGLQALAQRGAGSTATTTYGGASAGSQVQTIQTEMTVYVEGRVSGSDILLSGKKTQNNLSR